MPFGIWWIKIFFDGLSRGGNSIKKTYDGNKEALLKAVLVPPQK